MTTEKAKLEITEKITRLKSLLFQKVFSTYVDQMNFNKPSIRFNGSESVVEYENTIKSLLADVKRLVEFVHLNLLDDKKHAKLVEYLSSSISEPSDTNSITLDDLNPDLINSLNLYLNKQDEYKEISENFIRSLNSLSETASKEVKQIKWKGNQKQLAELFTNLIKKGWIDRPLDGEQSAFASNLVSIFDLRHTTSKDDENLAENLRHYLKPEGNGKSLRYLNCITASAPFQEIKNNEKSR